VSSAPCFANCVNLNDHALDHHTPLSGKTDTTHTVTEGGWGMGQVAVGRVLGSGWLIVPDADAIGPPWPSLRPLVQRQHGSG
jgi:hypothetical protein